MLTDLNSMNHAKLLSPFASLLLFNLTHGAVYAQKMGDVPLTKQQELKGTMGMPDEMKCLDVIAELNAEGPCTGDKSTRMTP